MKEWYFWLVSIATGAFMAFAYDVVRLFRRLVRHGRFAVDLEDILYWTACFGLSFTLLYYGNNGVIRFAAVFGAAVGMLVYAATAGRFFVKISYWLIDKTIGSLLRGIRRIFGRLQKLLRPIKCFAVKNYHKLGHLFISLFQKIQLTFTPKRHKIRKKNRSEETGEEESADGRKDGKRKAKRKKAGKKTKQKNTGVSPRPE